MADISQIRLPSGDTFDLIDEKSGYITAQYIENRTDYSIPVSRVGEIVVGETAIGTDSTNFPTSKAVVDYVDERVVQEIDAIDVGVTEVKANGTSLSVVNGVVNIPAIGPHQSVGLITEGILDNIYNEIPTSTSQLTNNSGFITASDVPTKTSQLTNDSGFITSDSDEKLGIDLFAHSSITSATYYPILSKNSNSSTPARRSYDSEFRYVFSNGKTVELNIGSDKFIGRLGLQNNGIITRLIPSATSQVFLTLPSTNGTLALISDIPTIPTNISAFTNDSGYLTSSDIASVMTYKGTKANYAALPASGNTIGDVWHLTDTGAEWAWDGSAWQELGTAIDLSGYVPTSRTINGKALTSNITLSASDVGAIDTETDPVFSASAAAGITSTDISNWNAKVSDDKTWNGIELDKRSISGYSGYIPYVQSTTSTTASLREMSDTPSSGRIAVYNNSSYLTSKTPSANDNSTKVATTAYVDAAIPDTSRFIPTTTNTTNINARDGFSLYQYNNTTTGGFRRLSLGNETDYKTQGGAYGIIRFFDGGQYYHGDLMPTLSLNGDQEWFLPAKSGTIALTSDIPKVYSSTNTGGYLTMATLPIYDGTVE